MSLGKVIHHIHQYIDQNTSDKAVSQLLIHILEHTDKTLIEMINEVMLYSKMTEKERLDRCIPIMLQYAAIHLADDIADKDCDYINDPLSIGTTLLCLLQNLAFTSVLKLEVDTKSLHEIYQGMTVVGCSQYEELVTRTWTMNKSLNLAENITGKQIAGYFEIALYGTRFHKSAYDIGNAFGITAHIASDIKDYDRRFTDLNEKERQQLKDAAFSSVRLVLKSDITCLRSYISPFIRYIN